MSTCLELGIPQGYLDCIKQYPSIDIAEFVGLNRRYINDHGVSSMALQRYVEHQTMIKEYWDRRPKNIPQPGDLITLRANGSIRGGERIYSKALIVSIKAKDAYICTEPYIPFLVDIQQVLKLDVSGGYWQHCPWAHLTDGQPDKTLIKFWGTSPTANGALYQSMPTMRWQLTSDLFY